ncbi:uncharacterized protein LOC106533430, partial [Austrofundulus limnaeus]|uniref:Uncharacterized protein LOC106533430 n=1 Tax=Austrofundulus limnaeus TaxID=52670 RepID=A0A2I4CYV0_AUSLI
METGGVLLLLLAGSSALSFYGGSISFLPLQRRTQDTVQVSFYHRQNGRNSCQNQNQSTFTCEEGACPIMERSDALQTDQDQSGQGRWCQTEEFTTTTVQSNRTRLTLRDSGCCWVSNAEGETSWMSLAQLDLGFRSDSHNFNTCPTTTAVSSLRIPQNCVSRVRLLAYDPDGDAVRCRFAPDATVPSNFTLDEAACTLTSAGGVHTGVHVLQLMLEDFPTTNITLTYADGTSVTRGARVLSSPPLCQVKVQFSVDVLPAISSCADADLLPMFLSRTPSHGDVL